MIRCIVGLKNPDAGYAATRHNAGAWCLDQLADRYRLSFLLDKKFMLEWAQLSEEGERIFLIKPLSYMNESGRVVAGFARFYRLLPEEILIAHDELDFSPGEIRLKGGGGHGGHNGLKDVIAHLGARDFHRLRIGIGHPGERDAVVGYVLQVPSPIEKKAIDGAIDRALAVFPDILAGNMIRATQHLHRNL